MLPAAPIVVVSPYIIHSTFSELEKDHGIAGVDRSGTARHVTMHKLYHVTVPIGFLHIIQYFTLILPSEFIYLSLILFCCFSNMCPNYIECPPL